jgi:hypothetical protein
VRGRFSFDHIQVAVADLEEAARRFQREHGLTALPGGRHPGRGTANMIVPLGGSYLELIAVVDRAEAEALPTSMRVARAVSSGRSFATWTVRTDDLDATRAALMEAGWALPPVDPGARRRPDGTEIVWRMQELVADGAFSPLPFLIEWRVEPGLYPGAARARHTSGAQAVTAVRLSHPDPDRARPCLRALLGDDLDWSLSRGEPGVAELRLSTSGDPLVLS